MAQQDFTAQVTAWVRKTERRMEAVFKESTQRVFTLVRTPVGAGGNMPVDTGFLRASFIASLNAPVEEITFNVDKSGSFGFSDGPVSLVIANAHLGQTIYGVFTASYARPVEYGANGRPGRGFVRLAAQQWPAIVQKVSREAQARRP